MWLGHRRRHWLTADRSETYTLLGMPVRFNFNFILPKVNTDYMRQAQVLNIDKLRLIINLRKFDENVK